MSRPLCSMVIATYQRAHLLKRSLLCYENQDFDNSKFELVVVDDHSTDGTKALVLAWSHRTGIKAVVVTPAPKLESWRDCGAVLNHGIRASTGRHVLMSHPEVMPGKRSVADCVDALERFECGRGSGNPGIGLYACCKVYYLSRREQELIDTCPWESDGALAVRKIDGFYEMDVNGLPDFSHRATDIVAQPGSRLPVWESWVFGGCSRETWRLMGGMLETQQWGSVDVSFMTRRRTLGVPNHTCPDEDTIVVHQNHDLPGDVVTDRSEKKWMDELRDVDLSTPSKLVWPHVDNL